MSRVDTTKNRQGTTYKVTFPTLPSLSLQPIKVDLIEEKGAHDILTLQFATTMPNWFTLLKTGVPVIFSYTQDSHNRAWVGYVSHVSKHVIGQLQQIMEVKCIGSTFGLKERASRVFTNMSITDAVGKIASEFGFRFVSDPHPVKFDQLVMAGHSYWEWIQEQAKKIGYGIAVEGMTLHFKPIDTFLQSGTSSVPILAMSGQAAVITTMVEDRTLDWFQVLNGEHIESKDNSRTVKVFGGVNPINASKHVQASSPKSTGQATRVAVSDVLFSESRQDQVSSSPSMAKALSDGAAHNARMNLPAKAKGQGDPRIRLFNPVMILGTGSQTDGLWMVTKAIHHFTANNNYQVDLDISTDGLGSHTQPYVVKTSNTVTGMVDLNEAVNNGGFSSKNVNHKAVKLTTNAHLVSENNQGWNRTPAKWVYSAVRGR